MSERDPLLDAVLASGVKLYKPCGHENAAVLANMQAVVYGEGSTK